MTLFIFKFVLNTINKNRVVIVGKGYHNVIYFSINNYLFTLSITNLDIFRLGYILSLSTS